MPYLIGQCCTDQISSDNSGGNGDASAKNEIVPFFNVSQLVIPWNTTRKAKFGDAAVFYIEILGEDGKYRPTPVQALPDNIVNTTQYSFDFGGPATGRVVIS